MTLEQRIREASDGVPYPYKGNLREIAVEARKMEDRIKRLEEALDTFTCLGELTPMKWNRALQEAFDMARAVLKAKKDKQ